MSIIERILRLLGVMVLIPIEKLYDDFILTTEITINKVDLYQWAPSGRTLLHAYNMSSLIQLDAESMTHIIIHGWHENSTQEPYELLAKNYYSLDESANIILVDYGKLAQESYLKAPLIVKIAGEMIGNQLIYLIKHGLIHTKRAHIFSHSLGTHVAGRAARTIQRTLNQTIARISASDPAGPLFFAPFGIGTLLEELTTSDADVLDITHTSYLTGTSVAFGTVDTFVDMKNGRQPGCVGGHSYDAIFFCDHRLARAYFTESILSCGFHQTRDNISIVYGEHMPLNASGIFRMQVNGSPPYAKDVNTSPNCW